MTPRSTPSPTPPQIQPAERQPWMTDEDWDNFIRWDRAVADHYGVQIDPDYSEEVRDDPA